MDTYLLTGDEPISVGNASEFVQNIGQSANRSFYPAHPVHLIWSSTPDIGFNSSCGPITVRKSLFTGCSGSFIGTVVKRVRQ